MLSRVVIGLSTCYTAASNSQASSCPISGECPASGKNTGEFGFTNITGWKPDGSGCCDICVGAEKVNCFDKTQCGHKTGDNDWDFAILDQIWLPQMCAALAEGHDPTVTHLPGTRCRDDATRKSGLSIHGLWPNYNAGYPQCCKHFDLPQDLPDDLVELASKEWVDPTTSSGDTCAFCSMWAHETLKHGTCLATDMKGYFRITLDLATGLSPQTGRGNEVLRRATNGRVPSSDLAKVYEPYRVQLLCDSLDPKGTKDTGVFLELRTCWSRRDSFSHEHPLAKDMVQIDCPSKDVGFACPEFIVAADTGDLGPMYTV